GFVMAVCLISSARGFRTVGKAACCDGAHGNVGNRVRRYSSYPTAKRDGSSIGSDTANDRPRRRSHCSFCVVDWIGRSGPSNFIANRQGLDFVAIDVPSLCIRNPRQVACREISKKKDPTRIVHFALSACRSEFIPTSAS